MLKAIKESAEGENVWLLGAKLQVSELERQGVGGDGKWLGCGSGERAGGICENVGSS